MELMSYRNLDYLHRNRIIYKRMPVTDIPTETYDWAGIVTGKHPIVRFFKFVS